MISIGAVVFFVLIAWPGLAWHSHQHDGAYAYWASDESTAGSSALLQRKVLILTDNILPHKRPASLQ